MVDIILNYLSFKKDILQGTVLMPWHHTFSATANSICPAILVIKEILKNVKQKISYYMLDILKKIDPG